MQYKITKLHLMKQKNKILYIYFDRTNVFVSATVRVLH